MSQLSTLMQSNLFTKLCAKQYIGRGPHIPPADVRQFCAKLIIEEMLETFAALGIELSVWERSPIYKRIVVTEDNISYEHASEYDADQIIRPDVLDGAIDGAIDLQYVVTGLLAAMGVPDQPHIDLVCRKNNLKFPGGKPVLREDGKYLKPEGWTPPNHIELLGGLPTSDMHLAAAAAKELILSKLALGQ